MHCACVGYFQFLVIGWGLQVPRVECGGVRSGMNWYCMRVIYDPVGSGLICW